MIRTLQRKLYVKAKTEPEYRFYSLIDKIYRRDVLEFAYRLAKANAGAPGVDGKTFAEIEAAGLEDWLRGLEEELCTGEYRPEAVKRVYIPKPGGGQRPLGIPTIRDRVAQTAALIVLEPIFEADLADEMYGYRPRRSAQGAVAAVHAALRQGYTDVVDADLTKYFDTIVHSELLRSVARRVSDGRVLHLLRSWLKAPVAERDGAGRWRRTGGKRHAYGTPQGGVVSPLLANIYFNRFLKAWRERKVGERLKARVISYADDFVICCCGTAGAALDVTRRWMTSLKLSLNESKTSVRDARQEHFDFLGYTFGPQYHRPTGHRYVGVAPSRKAVARLRDRVRDILRPSNVGSWAKTVQRTNRVLRGWANYFSYGHVTRAYWWVDAFVLHRARVFLTRRHKLPGRGTRRLPPAQIFGAGGLLWLGSPQRVRPSHA